MTVASPVSSRILGLGVSHYPPFSGLDEDMANIFRGRLDDPGVPESAKDPKSWPGPLRAEWGKDRGVAAATQHREAMLVGLRRVRQALDDFNPDFVVIWGDDQYENYKEDIVPAFSVLAYEDSVMHPWRDASESAMFDPSKVDEWGGGRPNIWGEAADVSFTLRGHRDVAKQIASSLIEQEFDVAYAYKPLHHPGLAHAFLNAVLYLDFDRKGWSYPVIPISVNCYGRRAISYRGFISRIDDHRPFDPPSPSPKRCFDLGAAIARTVRNMPGRVALIGSSSWSHAFLVDKTYRMLPDITADRKLYDAMVSGNYEVWRNYSLDELEDSAQQEVLNWFVLVGAMNELGMRVQWSDFVETYLFNSSKVSAIFGASET